MKISSKLVNTRCICYAKCVSCCRLWSILLSIDITDYCTINKEPTTRCSVHVVTLYFDRPGVERCLRSGVPSSSYRRATVRNCCSSKTNREAWKPLAMTYVSMIQYIISAVLDFDALIYVPLVSSYCWERILCREIAHSETHTTSGKPEYIMVDIRESTVR